jgi:hypothetical protein
MSNVDLQPFVKCESPLIRRFMMRDGEDHFSDALHPLALYFCKVAAVSWSILRYLLEDYSSFNEPPLSSRLSFR